MACFKQLALLVFGVVFELAWCLSLVPEQPLLQDDHHVHRLPHAGVGPAAV